MSTKSLSDRHESDANNKGIAGAKAASLDWSAIIGRHSMMLALEPRYMFDASVGDTAEAADPGPVGEDAGEGGDSGYGEGGGDAGNGGSQSGPDGDGDTGGGLDDFSFAARSFGSLDIMQTFGIGILAEDDGLTPPDGRELEVTYDDQTTWELIEGAGETAVPSIVMGAVDGPNEVVVTLSVENGVLSFAGQPVGVSIVNEDGTINNSLSWDSTSDTFILKGDVVSVNSALALMEYKPTDYYSGSDALDVDIRYSLYDLPNDPFGGYTDNYRTSVVINIDIEDVNNSASVLDANEDFITIAEDTMGAVPGISIVDPDESFEGGDTVTVTLSIANGKLTWGEDERFESIFVSGPTQEIEDGEIGVERLYTFQGRRDDVNDLLATLQYQGVEHWFGTENLVVSVIDDIDAAIVEDLSDPDNPIYAPEPATATVEIRVTPVPDAPEIDFEGKADDDDFLTATAKEGFDNFDPANAGVGVTLTPEMFGISDVDTLDALLSIRVEKLPENGSIYVYRVYANNPDGGAWYLMEEGDTFSLGHLESNRVKYVHNGEDTKVRDDVDGNGFYSQDFFYFTVTDGTGNYVTYTNADGEFITGDKVDEHIRISGSEGAPDAVYAAKVKFTINLESVNDSITLKPGGPLSRGEETPAEDPDAEPTTTLAVYEGEDKAILQFGIVDTDQDPDVSHDIYITKLPVDGKLYWNGEEVTFAYIDAIGMEGYLITQDGLDAGLLTYDHNGYDSGMAGFEDYSGSTRNDSFGVVVVDDGGGTGVQKQYDQEEMTIIVYPNNDNPEFTYEVPADNHLGSEQTTIENWSLVPLPASYFSVTDSDSAPASISYQLTEDLTNSFEIYIKVGDNYRLLGAGKSFTQADIDAGNVYFRYTGQAGDRVEVPEDDPKYNPPSTREDPKTGLNYVDEQGNEIEFTQYRYTSSTTLSFTVTDGSITAWARDDKGDVHEEGVIGGIGEWVDGEWTLSTFTVTLGADIYVQFPGESYVIEEATDIDVGVTKGDPMSGYEDGSITLTTDNITAFTTYKLDGEPKTEANPGIVYRLMDLPDYGSLLKYGVAMTQYESFTQADLEAGIITYAHGGGEIFADSFAVTVSDGVNFWGSSLAEPKGANIVIDINLSPVNDTPVVGGELNVNEGWEATQDVGNEHAEMGVVINLGDIYSDSDGGGELTVKPGYDLNGADGASYADVNANVKVVITEGPKYGTLYLYSGTGDRNDIANWVEIVTADKAEASASADWSDLEQGTILTAADFAAGNVRYIHNGLDSGDDSGFLDGFKIIANDGKGVDPAGENLEITDGDGKVVASGKHSSSLSEEATVSVVIKQKNDAPVYQKNPTPFTTPEGGDRKDEDPTAYLTEGVGTVIESEHLSHLDSDHNPDELQYVITSAPANGVLYKKDSAGGAWYALELSVFTQKDIDQGFIKYVHNGTETNADSFSYTVYDTIGASASGTFEITVEQTNDAPKIEMVENNFGEDGRYLSSESGKNLFIFDDDTNVGKGVFQITDIDTTNAEYESDALVTVTITAVITGDPSVATLQKGDNWGIFTYGAADPDAAGGGSVTGKDVAGGSMTITGTMTEIQAILDSLVYKPEGTGKAQTDIDANVTITVEVVDLGNGDKGLDDDYELTDSTSVVIFVSTFNDNPYFEDLTTTDDDNHTNQFGELFVMEMNEDARNVVIQGGLSNSLLKIVDNDAYHRNVNTVVLTVSNGVLNIPSSAISTKELIVSDNNSSEITLVGTRDAINAALARLNYSPDANWNGVDTLEIVYNDGNSETTNGDPGADGQWGTGEDGQKGFTAEVTLKVYPVNDKATIEKPAEVIVIQGGNSDPKPIKVSTGTDTWAYIRVDDPNDLDIVDGTDDPSDWPDRQWENDIVTVTLTATNQTDGGSDGALTVDTVAGVTLGTNGTSSITLTGTRDAVNAALETLTYTPAGASTDQVIELSIEVDDQVNGALTGETDATRALEFTVEDTITLIVSDDNDKPVVTIDQDLINSGFVVNEDSSKSFGVGDLVITDPDAGDLPLILTVSVTKGTLTVNRQGINILNDAIDYSSDNRSITITGTQANLTKILATLTYKPDAEYNGPDILTIHVDDQGNSAYNATSTALSDTQYLDIIVTPVNDAPVLQNVPAGGLSVGTITEDIEDSANTGKTIADLFPANMFQDTKDNVTGGTSSDTFAGIVVVNNAATPAQGVWQYDDGNGTNTGWTDFPAGITGANALYLASNVSIRFVPATDYNGTPGALTVRIVETDANADSTGSQPAASGQTYDAATVGGSTRYSSASTTIGVAVTAVNDAPRVTVGTTAPLSVAEDITSAANAGYTVEGLFGGYFDDSKDDNQSVAKDSFAGVMIFANDTTNAATRGQWEYSTDNGATWHAVGVVSQTSALYLAAGTSLRFQPAPDWNGTPPAIEAYLVETKNTDGGSDYTATAGATRSLNDATLRGEATSLSANKVTLSIAVTPVNDAPVFNGSKDVIGETLAEDSAAGAGKTVAEMFGGLYDDTKDDVADGAFDSTFRDNFIGIVIVGGGAADAAKQGVWQYSTDGGTNWTAMSAYSEANALYLDVDAKVRFVPVENFNGDAPKLEVRLVEDNLNDDASSTSPTLVSGTSVNVTATGSSAVFSADKGTYTVTVTPTNDAPVVAGSGSVNLISADAGKNIIYSWPNYYDAAGGTDTAQIGKTVADLFGGSYGDPNDSADYSAHNAVAANVDSLAGVLIVGNGADSVTEGDWQYWTGTAWENIGSRTEATGLYLAKDVYVRFQPIEGSTDTTPTLTVLLVETADGDGDTVMRPPANMTGGHDATVRGGDTIYSAASVTLSVTVAAPNKQPVVTLPGTAVEKTIVEDEPSNTGWTVSSIFNDKLDDSGDTVVDTLAGVVIVGGTTDANAGDWQYYVAESGWVNIGARTATTGLYLAEGTLIRFNPKADYNGPAPTLEAVLVETIVNAGNLPGTVNPAHLDIVDMTAVYRGVYSQYTADTAKLALTVTPVNDAPVIANIPVGGVTLDSIAEDVADAANTGSTVGDLFPAGMFDDTKDASTVSSSDAFAGIVVVNNAATSAQGEWQYDDGAGGNWTAFPAGISSTNALYLASNVSIRFVPATDYNGAPGVLTVRSVETVGYDDTWTGTQPVTSGQRYNASTFGGSTLYSSNTANIGVTVTPVNDAPNWDDTTDQSLGQVVAWENYDAHKGKTVEDLFGGRYADDKDTVDESKFYKDGNADAFAGVMIIADLSDAAAEGLWQYSDDNENWTTIENISEDNALFLAKDMYLRFLPEEGTPASPALHYEPGTLEVLLVETSGAGDDTAESVPANEARADVTGRDGNSIYSEDSVLLKVTVSTANNAPEIDTTKIPTDKVINEDVGDSATNNPGYLVTDLFGDAFTDEIDDGKPVELHDSFAGVVVIGNEAKPATQGVWQYWDGSAWIGIPTGDDGLDAENGLFLAADAATKIRFVPVTDYNGTPPGLTLVFAETPNGDSLPGAAEAFPTATGESVDASQRGDSTQFSQATAEFKIAVAAVNDAPKVDAGFDDEVSLGSLTEDVSGVGLKESMPGTAPTDFVNSGDTVENLFGGAFNDSKDDNQSVSEDAFAGVAVVVNGAAGNAAGDWQFWNGTAWETIGACSADSAVYLAKDTHIRFQPAANYNGPAPEIEVVLVETAEAGDEAGGTAVPANGAKNVDTRDAAKTGIFGYENISLGVTVNPVNDAPLARNTAKMTVTVAEDVSSTAVREGGDATDPTHYVNPGETVGSLFAGNFLDTDDANQAKGADSLAGVAVVISGSSASGEWQYWNGTAWENIGDCSGTNALYLAADAYIRFQPAANFNGVAPDLAVRLVETFNGDEGSAVIVLANGTSLAAATEAATGQRIQAEYTPTGLFSNNIVTLSQGVTPVNDAPAIPDTFKNPYLADIDEDDKDSAGSSVSTLFPAAAFSDPDDEGRQYGSDDFAGVVIVNNAATSAQGVWQYKVGAGEWQSISTGLDADAALYLPKDALLRFVPADDYHGDPGKLTVRIVEDDSNNIMPDATYPITDFATAQGGVAVGSGGGISVFSGETATVGISVKPVNDAPLVEGGSGQSIDMDLVVKEDVGSDDGKGLMSTVRTDYVNPGEEVGDLFAALFRDTNDSKSGASDSFVGVAVVNNASDASGEWQYWTGTGWASIGTCSTTNALYLAADAYVRFQPAADFNGEAPALTVRLVEGFNGDEGSTVIVLENGTPLAAGTEASTGQRIQAGYSAAGLFSQDTVTLKQDVSPVNDAPAIPDTFKDPYLADIDEDDKNSAGSFVSTLFPAAAFSDPNDEGRQYGSDAFAGVVIVNNAATSAQGVWQYKVDAGEWQSISTGLDADAALYLPKNAIIRFVPADDFNGTPGELTVRIVEDDSNKLPLDAIHPIVDFAAAQDGVAVGSGGGVSIFSGETSTISIEVKPVNDAPLVDGGSGQSVEMALEVKEDVGAGFDTDSTDRMDYFNPGEKVEGLFSGLFADTDDADQTKAADSFAGIAVTANGSNPDEGVWQYWDQAAGTWVDIAAGCSVDNAVYLSKDAYIRFQPGTDFNGDSPTLKVVLVENLNGDEPAGTPDPASFAEGGLVDATHTASGIYSENDITLVQDVTAVNDAPQALDAADPVMLGNISASGVEQAGEKVSDLFGDRIDDPKDDADVSSHRSSDALAGIVVVGNAADPATEGVWQYFDSVQDIWVDIVSSNDGDPLTTDLGYDNGLFLDADTLIRFQPVTNYRGNPEPLAVLLAETIDADNAVGESVPANYTAGVDVSTGKRGGTTIYSENALEVGIYVGDANSAPVPADADPIDVSMDEDAFTADDLTTSSGSTVDDLFGSVYSDPGDAAKYLPGVGQLQPDEFAGVVIVANDLTNAEAEGEWHYSIDGGQTWQKVGAVAYDNGLYLDVDARLCFVPAADYNGAPPALEVLLAETIDNGDAAPNTELPDNGDRGVDAGDGKRGGSTPFSEDAVSLQVTVNPVNDAPTIDDKDVNVVREIDEDVADAANAGWTVSDLFGDRFQDAGDGAGDHGSDSFLGVAVVGGSANPVTEGVWYYDTGSGWVAFPDLVPPDDLNDGNALFLAGDAKIRFVPVADYNGTPPTLTVRYVETDQATPDAKPGMTVPASGQRVDLTALGLGGESRYSADTIQFAVSVKAVNDAPTLGGASSQSLQPVVSFDDTAVAEGISEAKSVGDLFAGTYRDTKDGASPSNSGGDAFAGVVITGNAADPATEGVWQYSLDNGDSWTAIDASAVSEANGLYLASTALLRFNPADGATVAAADAALTLVLAETNDNADAVTGSALPASGGTVNVAVRGGGTLYSRDSATLHIEVRAPNTAPAFDDSRDASLGSVNENDSAGVHVSVEDLFGNRFDDSADDGKGWVAKDEFAGVVVIANPADPATEGVYQYRLAGDEWQAIGTVSETNGLFLDKDAEIRFVPATGYNGDAPELTLVLAETVNADSAPGALLPGAGQSVNVAGGNRGGITPYSAESVKLGVSVVAVNSAPELKAGAGAAVELVGIAEDDRNSAGGLVKDLFKDIVTDDKDSAGDNGTDDFIGVVVVGNTADPVGEGVWQYWDANAGDWADIPSGTLDAADGLFLAADADTRIRFVPVADYNGAPPALTVRLVENDANADATTAPADIPTTTGQRNVDTGVNGGSTVYGADQISVGMTVTPVNDAPEIEGAADAALETVVSFPGAISESKSVEDLFGGKYKDAKDGEAPSASGGDSFAGVVITANAADPDSEGVWQYSLDNGDTWTTIDAAAVSEADGLYLAKDALLRFEPVFGAEFEAADASLVAALAETNDNLDPAGGNALPASGGTVDVTTRGGDTLYSGASVSLGIKIRGANNAPEADASLPDTVTLTMDEDAAASDPKTVENLFGGHFDDSKDEGKGWVAKDDFAGVVVIANPADSETEGVYQYRLPGGEWTDIVVTGDTDGLYLAKDAEIRFVPVADFNGDAPALSAVLVETVNGDSPAGTTLPASGGRVDVAGDKRGNTTPYGDDVIGFAVSVDPVNDAPLVDDAAPGSALILPEDISAGYASDPTDRADYFNSGGKVSDLFGGLFSDANDEGQQLPADAFAGVAIVVNGSHDSTAGSWQYWTGSGWQDIGDCSVSGALFLSADSHIRFQPAANFNGDAPGLEARLVESLNGDEAAGAFDASDPANNGARIDASYSDTGVFSEDNAFLNAVVRAVNDAPVVNGSAAATLDTVISFPGAASGGKTVADLFGGKYSDPSDTAAVSASGGDAFAGVAILADASTPEQGSWEYSLDGGDTWLKVSDKAPGESNALYLDGTAELRFNPADGYAGEPGKLTLVLVENDANADAGSLPVLENGGSLNAETRGGTSIFSGSEMTLGIEVRSPNTSPVAGAPAVSLTAIDEDDRSCTGDTVGDLFGPLFDDAGDDGKGWVDKDELAGVVITANSADPETEGVYQYRTAGGEWKEIGVCGEANGLFLDCDTLIRFVPVPDYHGEPPALSAVLVETVNADSPAGACVPGCEDRVDVGGTNRGGLTCFGEELVSLGVRVRSVDDDPIAEDDSARIVITNNKTGTVEGNVKDNDSHPDDLDFAVDVSKTGQGQYGTLALRPDGTFVYTVDPKAPGLATLNVSQTLYDTISYTVVDSSGNTATAELRLEIVYQHSDDCPLDDKPVDNTGNSDGNPGFGDLEQELALPPVVDNVNNSLNLTENQLVESQNNFREQMGVGKGLVSSVNSLGEPHPIDWTLIGGVDEKEIVPGESQAVGLSNELHIHSQPNERLTYVAMMVDGSPLHDWIEFDDESFTLICTPPEDHTDSVEVIIRGEDTRGNRADALVILKVADAALTASEEEEELLDQLDADVKELSEESGEGDDSEIVEGEESGGEGDSAEVPVPEDLAALRRMLLDDGAPAEEAPAAPEGYAGLRRQLDETGGGGLLSGARVLLSSLLDA